MFQTLHEISKKKKRIYTKKVHLANLETVHLWWKKALDNSWLGHLLFSFLILDQFLFTMRKGKTTPLILKAYFYFNEALKRIVFQLELNAFLITCLFILKSQRAILNSKNGFL